MGGNYYFDCRNSNCLLCVLPSFCRESPIDIILNFELFWKVLSYNKHTTVLHPAYKYH